MGTAHGRFDRNTLGTHRRLAKSSAGRIGAIDRGYRNRHLGVYKLNADEQAAIEQGLEEMRQGKFASDDEVAALFNRYRS